MVIKIVECGLCHKPQLLAKIKDETGLVYNIASSVMEVYNPKNVRCLECFAKEVSEKILLEKRGASINPGIFQLVKRDGRFCVKIMNTDKIVFKNIGTQGSVRRDATGTRLVLSDAHKRLWHVYAERDGDRIYKVFLPANSGTKIYI